MKSIKKLVVLFIVANVFNACTEDEVSYALQNVSAPTNVSAIFNVSNDDTGTVTLTPTAEGATSFNVYFGDVDDETPTAVSPGEETSHVYGEGEFTLRIVALGASGLTSELSRIVTISFTPPSELAVTTEITASNPFEITVTPTATNATVFDIYFGDVDEEEPTTIMDGETANHIYAEAGDYTVRVVARGAGAATIESSETITILGNSNPIILPITFDDATVNYAFGTFNGASFEVVDNPDTSGVNTEASKVGAITNSGNQFEGGAFSLGTPVDFSDADKTITMKFWSNVSVPILLKFEGGVNDERQNEVVTTHGGTGWEELSFDFATDAIKSFIDGSQGAGEAFVPTGQYATMVIFVDGPGTTAGTFYVDDIAKEGSGAVAPQLPLDFESTTINYVINGFGASDFGAIPAAIIDNPDSSSNSSTKVLEINKLSGAQTYAGAGIPLDGAIDFSESTTVTIKVWSPRVGTPIRFKIEDSSSPPDGNGNPTVFAEVEVNSTVAMAWEELSFDMTNPIAGSFNTSISFDTAIIFPDFNSAGNGELFYFDDIAVLGTIVGEAPQLPLDFESTTINYVINGFGAADFGAIPAGIMDNPDTSGNLSTKVLEINKLSGAQTYAGAGIPLSGAIDFSTSTTVRIKVWSPRIGTPIRFKIEDSSSPPDGNGNPTVFAEVEVNSTVAMAWEELTFDMTNPVAGAFNTSISFDTAIVFPDFGSAGLGELFYFDDITQQ